MIAINRIVFTLLFLYSFASCRSSTDESIESILAQSGGNRSEWEKVLRRYSSEEDSLERKAVIFLLKNMPGHYSLEGEFINRFNSRLREDHPQNNYAWYKAVETVPEKTPYRELCYKAYDLEWLKGEFVISHILKMFQLWRTTPWLKNLEFQDFCEYLLPYRISNERPDNFTDTVIVNVEKLKREIRKYSMQFTPSGLYELLKITFPEEASFQYCELALGDNQATFMPDCQHAAYYDFYRLKSAGLPVALDFVPFWGRKDGRHYWCAVIDPAHPNKIQPTTVDYPPKVYRYTYSHQPYPQTNQGESIPELFDTPFMKDVTSYYTNTSTVEVPISTPKANPRYAYLCVFNEREWQAVSWAEIRNGKAVFPQMGRGMVYLPIYYQKGSPCPSGNPFILHENGKIEALIADTTHLQTLCLTRKTPMEIRKLEWSQKLKGSYIEVSDELDFKKSKIIARMDSILTDHNVIMTNEAGEYRFLRVVAPEHAYLGELNFFTKNGEKVTGNILSAPEYEKYFKHEHIFDSDPLTYGVVYGEMTVDFGKAVNINKIHYLPRNDANAIFPGNRYELKYHNGKE